MVFPAKAFLETSVPFESRMGPSNKSRAVEEAFSFAEAQRPESKMAKANARL
jgi:hypothetical protein